MWGRARTFMVVVMGGNHKASLGLASLSKFSVFWGIGQFLVVCYLALGD